MNKQILEIAERAGYHINGGKIFIRTTSEDITSCQQKFAELLVKECGEYLMRSEFIGRSDLDWSMVLNEYFGVEE